MGGGGEICLVNFLECLFCTTGYVSSHSSKVNVFTTLDADGKLALNGANTLSQSSILHTRNTSPLNKLYSW